MSSSLRTFSVISANRKSFADPCIILINDTPLPCGRLDTHQENTTGLHVTALPVWGDFSPRCVEVQITLHERGKDTQLVVKLIIPLEGNEVTTENLNTEDDRWLPETPPSTVLDSLRSTHETVECVSIAGTGAKVAWNRHLEEGRLSAYSSLLQQTKQILHHVSGTVSFKLLVPSSDNFNRSWSGVLKEEIVPFEIFDRQHSNMGYLKVNTIDLDIDDERSDRGIPAGDFLSWKHRHVVLTASVGDEMRFVTKKAEACFKGKFKLRCRCVRHVDPQ